jgi:hypothetical protein
MRPATEGVRGVGSGGKDVERGRERKRGGRREREREERGRRRRERERAVAGGDLAIAFVINNYRHRAVIQ